MAANTKVPGPNFAGIMRHAEQRGNKSGSAGGMAKVPLMAMRIKGGSADTPSPTKSVVTPSQPTAAAVRGNVGKSGVKMAPYDQTPNPRKPASYKR
jgi:hypothetical protein